MLPCGFSTKNKQGLVNLNAALLGAMQGCGFLALHPHAGGPKNMELSLYGMASNHLATDTLAQLVVEAFTAAWAPSWRHQNDKQIQLLVCEQDDEEDRFREVPLPWPEAPV